MQSELRFSTVAFVARHLTSAIDQGLLDTISFDEIYRAIETGNLVDLLENKLGDYDWGILDPVLLDKPNDQRQLFLDAIQSKAVIFKGYERDWGIRNTGVCLLLALCIEIMQYEVSNDRS